MYTVQVQAVKWVVLQQICQTLMNKPLRTNSMMISKCVNANAPTLKRSPRLTFVSDLMGWGGFPDVEQGGKIWVKKHLSEASFIFQFVKQKTPFGTIFC